MTDQIEGSEQAPAAQPDSAQPSISTSPHLSTVSNPVQQNYLARQVLRAQDRIQEKFQFRSSLDAVFWINGAAAICKHCNVRDEKTIADVLTSELWNCTIIQNSIDHHLQFHSRQKSTCSTVCLSQFCLADDAIYTKPTSVITSALSRYQKPAEMDVQEHLTAHLQKERDLLRRRTPSISEVSIHLSLYGTDTEHGEHSTGSGENTAIARILDSLRPTKPYLMEHLDKLELLQSFSGWTLSSLIKAIQLYERKLNETTHAVGSSSDSASISHNRTKLRARVEWRGFHSYDFYDPTMYMSHTHTVVEEVGKTETKNKSESDTCQLLEQIPGTSFISSINRLSSVTEALHKLYSSNSSGTPQLLERQPQPDKSSLQVNTRISKAHQSSRVPTHCMRCGSKDHIIWQCKQEDDDIAEKLREQNESSAGFRPHPRYKDRGRSFAHTWAFRERLWPKAWLKPFSNDQEND